MNAAANAIKILSALYIDKQTDNRKDVKRVNRVKSGRPYFLKVYLQQIAIKEIVIIPTEAMT